jgi:CRP-like cAMP-binding protein
MVDSSTLQKCALFGGLLQEQIETVLPLMEHETYDTGDNVIVEGDQNDKIRFIVEGRVVVTKKGRILFEFGEGESFGEMEVLDIMPSAATIRAKIPTSVMSLSNKSLHDIYKKDINVFAMLIMNLARDVSRRLRTMDEKIAEESPFLEWS